MISYEYVSNQIWAIREENLKTILEITSRTNPSLEVIEAKLGQKLQNSRVTKVENSTKVIQVRGPIVRYGNVFTEVSGATSLSQIEEDFKVALNDESITSILFDIDSPGGEASGIEEFAEQIYNARGQKPMTSYVGNMACSAAYWIASATDKIIAGKTATLGSIGCVAVIKDTEERDAKEGVKNVKFISSNSPNKRPDITTDEGKSLIQEQIDVIGDIFIETVARNRSTQNKELSFRDVVKDFNKGGVLIGKSAVLAGLADELGSYESTLQNLTSGDLPVLANEQETSMELENKNMENMEEDANLSEIEDNKNNPTLNELIVSEGLVPTVSLKQFEALKASNAEMLKQLEVITLQASKSEDERIKLEAKSKAESFKDKMVPAQVGTFTTAYIQASKDDKDNPVENYSRVGTLVSVWETAPNHNLTSELLEDDENSVLENNAGENVDPKEQIKIQAQEQVDAYLASMKKVK